MQKNVHRRSKTSMGMRGHRGAAMLEFAFVLPILLLIVFGMIESGVLFYNKAMITNASREGARYGVARCYCDPGNEDNWWPPDNQITEKVNAYLGNHLISFGDESKEITTTITRAALAAGDPLTVQVDFHYGFLILPSFIADLAGGITLTGVTTMRLE